jgi:hypothetical protein
VANVGLAFLTQQASDVDYVMTAGLEDFLLLPYCISSSNQTNALMLHK